MEGIDWFWLFMMLCLFSFIITSSIKGVLSQQFKIVGLDEILRNLEYNIEEIKSDVDSMKVDVFDLAHPDKEDNDPLREAFTDPDEI